MWSLPPVAIGLLLAAVVFGTTGDGSSPTGDGQIAKRKLVAGDGVRVIQGRHKGEQGQVTRVLRRRVRRRFMVDLDNGPVRRFPRAWLMFVPLPPLGQPSCDSNWVGVTSTGAVRSNVEAGRSVCVTASIGDVDLEGLTSSTMRYVGTAPGGSMGFVDLTDSSQITLRARFRSTEMRNSSSITIENSVIGGTQDNRVSDQLIFMPETNNDITIRDSDIGWTIADDSGNTGYGCRCFGANNRFHFIRNRVHDIAADGFQGVGGSDVVIDRNEFGPVGRNPSSDEHSDNIQITGNGPNLRITNNWIHHQGYYNGDVVGNSGATYIHGGTSNSLLFENNLIQTAQGRVEIGGLGTGGTTRSNITVRRNTFYDLGLAFGNFPGFEWDIDSGSGNLVERNAAWDPDGGLAMGGSPGSATFRDNVFTDSTSQVALDADGNCLTAACRPSGQEPIGYRKPTGVHWSPPGHHPRPVHCSGRQATIVGTSSSDVLRGTGGKDVIAGLGGRDRLFGLKGPDRLCGGAGDDVLKGGPGPDRCSGGKGDDGGRGCEKGKL